MHARRRSLDDQIRALAEEHRREGGASQELAVAALVRQREELDAEIRPALLQVIKPREPFVERVVAALAPYTEKAAKRALTALGNLRDELGLLRLCADAIVCAGGEVERLPITATTFHWLEAALRRHAECPQ